MCQDLCHLASFPFCSWETTDFSSLDVWNYIFIGINGRTLWHDLSLPCPVIKLKYSNFETCFTIIIIKTNPVFGFFIISLWDTYLLLSVVHSFGAFIFRHRMRSSSEALHHKRFGRNLYVSHNFIFRHWPPRRTYYYPPHETFV